MEDVRAVAERARGKRTWSIEDVRAAIPKMRRRVIRRELRMRYGGSFRAGITQGPTGWSQPPGSQAVHWFLNGWALCGWGLLSNFYGRPEDEDSIECPACRRGIERAKVA